MGRILSFKRINFSDKNLVLFLIYSLLLFWLILSTPNALHHFKKHFYIVGIFGFIGIYRFSLWVIHLVRAQIYEKCVYAKIKKDAENFAENQWKPDRLYFMMVSYAEDRKILYNSIKSIVQEARSLDLPATICMGSACFHDEKVVSGVINTIPYGDRIKVIFVRQKTPNKRIQIGRALRAMARQGVKDNDPVVFMDGDSIVMPGCLRKCLPVFKLFPDVHSVTTNEKAVVTNSSFLSNILSLRFAIRNFHMNSLALSRKVLCLTGRFSVFRASQILDEEFISRIEKDYIDDWYWERIYFVSGDDKSTWYSLLKKNAKMLYIPDAFIYSIEKAKKNPVINYVENLKRWSGNMLRNNGRALALGPRKTGFFPWLILLDQRISMWTAIISPSVMILTLFRDIQLTYMIGVWILFIKYVQSLLIFYYGRQINYTFPIIYYIHQFLNAVVKIYMLFHLRVQRWNNQNITIEINSSREKFHFVFAKYVTGLYLVIFLILINLLINLSH